MEENQVMTVEADTHVSNGVPLVRIPRKAKPKTEPVAETADDREHASLIDTYDRLRNELAARQALLLAELERISERLGQQPHATPAEKPSGRPAKAAAAPETSKPKAKRAKAGKRLSRRSQEDVKMQAIKVEAYIRTQKPEGLRAEQIREHFGYDRREVPAILKLAVASKLLKTKGQKRATTYTAKAAK